MVDPSLTVSVDRTALSLPPLVFSGTPGDTSTTLGLSEYVEPPMQARVLTAPTSPFIHGEIPLAWTWQQSLLQWSFFTEVDTEAESRALVAEVRAALSQALEFPVTVTVSGAAPETWTCSPGSLSMSNGRRYEDLSHAFPVWSVSLPCYPVRVVA